MIEAGRYAPSGGNSQSTHFIVVENKNILRDLAALGYADTEDGMPIRTPLDRIGNEVTYIK